MVKRHTKRYSVMLIIKEMKIKTTMRSSSHTSQDGHHQKNLRIKNNGEGMEKKKPSYTVGGKVNWYQFSCSVVSDSATP